MSEFQQDTWTAIEYPERRLVMASVMEHLSLCIKTLNNRQGQCKGKTPALTERDLYNQVPY